MEVKVFLLLPCFPLVVMFFTVVLTADASQLSISKGVERKQECNATETGCPACLECCLKGAKNLAEQSSCADGCQFTYGPDKCYGCQNGGKFCGCAGCLECCKASSNFGNYLDCEERCYATSCSTGDCPKQTKGCAACLGCCFDQADDRAELNSCDESCLRSHDPEQCGEYCGAGNVRKCCETGCKEGVGPGR